MEQPSANGNATEPTPTREFVFTSLGVGAYVEVKETYFLSDVRRALIQDLDQDQLPDPDFVFLINDIRISKKQESRKLAFDVLNQNARVELISRRKENTEEKQVDSVKKMAEDIAFLKEALTKMEQKQQSSGTVNNAATEYTKFIMRLRKRWKHNDGIERRIPPGWKFPKVGLMILYQQWHCGDESNNIPPLKTLDKDDVLCLSRGRVTLSEITRVMRLIDNEARKVIHVKFYMTLAEATMAFQAGESAILSQIKTTTPTNRARNVSKLKLSSIIHCMRKR